MSEWTQERHEAARAACEKATEGPWAASEETTWEDDAHLTPQKAVLHADNPITWDDHGGAVFFPDDAAFIALSRTELPAALDEIERLQRVVGRLQNIADYYRTLSQSQWAVTDEMVERAARCWVEMDRKDYSDEDTRDGYRAEVREILEAALGVKA